MSPMTAVPRRYPDDYQTRDGVWAPRDGAPAFAYSDGDAREDALAEFLAKTDDLSTMSPGLRGFRGGWFGHYHLSPARANLLRPFAGLLGGRVLEIGAGCGALTRYLGERGGALVALEGAARRARIAAARVRDLGNVAIVQDDALAFHADPFDVVCLVGVLEYARRFAGADGQAMLLNAVTRLLARDGLLILAIENQLGLKYLAGAKEDHVGVPFHGVNDLYRADGVATFGRAELAAMLRDAGLPAQAWYVPVPDYKLPVTVISPAGLEAPAMPLHDLLAGGVHADRQRIAHPRFSLEQAWGVAARNRLVLDLASSHLVVAGRSRDALRRLAAHDSQLAWHYAVERAPAYARELSFTASSDGSIMTRRAAIAPAAPAQGLIGATGDEPLAPGRTWWIELIAIVNRPGWTVDQLADWARPWIDALARAANAAARDAPIDGGLIDAGPRNWVRGPAGDRFIDLEWNVATPITLGFVAHRGLIDALIKITSVAPPASGTPTRLPALAALVLDRLGLALDPATQAAYLAREREFQALTRGEPPATGPAMDRELPVRGAAS